MSVGFTVETLGEDALLLRFGDAIDLVINRKVHACAAALSRQRPPWLLDIVPAFSTLALSIDFEAFADSAEPLVDVQRWLESRNFEGIAGDAVAGEHAHQISVRYGGEFGPDLDAVARHAGLTPEELVRRHASVDYRVGMLGFAAGFPYLIGMDPQLSMPRHATPRTKVDAGSVGIAGAQTGVYPRSGPGGWQIIGRTEEILFDAHREDPALLHPGDIVRFVDASEPCGSSA